MRLITLLIVLLLFSGCSIKEEPKVVTEYKAICIKQELYPYDAPVKVRVHPQDLEIHQARTNYLKKGFDFYESQVNRNNECLRSEDKENK